MKTRTLKTDIQIVHLQKGRRRSYAPTARVVEPTTGVVPAQGKGNLYMLVEISGDDAAAIPRLYWELLSRIQETYYAAPGDVTKAITEAIQEAHGFLQRYNQRHHTHFNAGVTCLVVTSQELLSAQAGPTILAVRSRQGLQWFSPLNHEDYIALGEEDTPAVEIGRVPGHAGLIMVAMNSAWANYLEVSLMLEATAIPKARAVADQIAGIGIDAEEELTALVITLQENVTRAQGRPPERLPQAAEMAQPSAEMPEPPPEALAEEEPGWEDLYETPRAVQQDAHKPRKTSRRLPLPSIRGLGPRGRKPSKSSLPAAGTAPPSARPRRIPYVLGIIAVLIVGVALLTGGMWFYQNQQRQKLFEQFLQSATIQLNQAQQLDDLERKRQALHTAQQQLDQAQQLDPTDPRVPQMEAKIREYLAEINKVVSLMAGFDVSLYDFTDPASNPSELFVNGLGVFVLDTGRGVFERFQLDDATGNRLAQNVENPKILLQTGDTVEGRTVGQLAHAIWAPAAGNRTVTGPLILDQGTQLFSISEGLGPVNVALAENPNLQFVNGLYYYNGNIYLLDSVGGQLWRYRPSGSNYMNPPEPYFPNETVVNLKPVIDVGIDGYVWLLYPNGSMLKFLSGIQQPFALEKVDPPLTQAVALWMNAAEDELGRIFIADAATNRVLVFDKQGKFLAQLTPLEHADVLADLKDIYVDELTNTMYLLTQTAIYQTPLPTLETNP